MERYLDDSLEKAKSVIGSSGYTINIYDEKKRRLKSVAVGGVPAGQDHRTYLETWARDIVAKEGYEPDRISVDVDKVHRHHDKGKSMELNRPQPRNASPR